jgi:ABC-type glycerol-3-phosphate transport system permease component
MKALSRMKARRSTRSPSAPAVGNLLFCSLLGYALAKLDFPGRKAPFLSIGQNRTDFGLLLAGAVVVILPVLILLLPLQRHFMRGIATTGPK